MKKISFLATLLIMIFAFSACGKELSEENTVNGELTNQETINEESANQEVSENEITDATSDTHINMGSLADIDTSNPYEFANHLHSVIMTVAYSPDIFTNEEYIAYYNSMRGTTTDLCEWNTTENLFTAYIANILGITDFASLKDYVDCEGFTGSIWITIEGDEIVQSDGVTTSGLRSITIELDGTDCIIR